MKASELRIGNYVNFGVVNEPIKILSINPSSTTIEMASPIPLTEEWLLKLGFEKQSGRFYVLNNWVVEYREGTKLFNFVAEEPIDIIVKYVHNLQNLYFALTGEELILEP